MKVTFEIKVYENDWKYVLYGNYLEKLINNCNHNFYCKQLVINNVLDVAAVRKYAEKKIREGIIDRIVVVEENVSTVLSYFDLSPESFKDGYKYSIAELMGIYFCETEYLFHFSSDSFVRKFEFDWIKKTTGYLEEADNFVVANPVWNNKYDEAKKESKYEIDNFFVGYGFSDQCYLIKAEYFRKNIYNHTNLESERYPKYGGELFEKKVDSFMRNTELFRITSKELSYFHVNFPKRSFWYNFKLYIYYVSKKRLK
ncbi:hypothetical protein [Flavobacterium gawalongense]|uniref:hypothetical protein n=1 Tax=Flavobacterium gawalongense TaxID=2594432 RepID=UPI00163D7F98|nr:hypothetical protein [Flavobacterium gawalongense]